MTTVLDSPVTTNRVGKLFHLDGQTADEIAYLSGLFSIADAAEKCDPDRKQSLPIIESRQAFGSGHLNVGSPLDPAVLLFHGVQSTSADPLVVCIRLFEDIVDGCVMQCSLVSFQRQDEVPSTINNFLRDGRLCPHRVDGDDGSMDIDERQKCGNRCYFVRFLGRCHLRECQTE